MGKRRKLNRRHFLYLSAATAGGAVITACGGDGGGNPTAGADGTAGAGVPTVGGAGQPTSSPVAAGTAAIDTGRATEVRASTTQYKEAPSLAALVEQGQLPPVAERLPTKPYVVPHQWVKQGKYGGQIQMVTQDTWGMGHFVQESMYGHSPVRWLKDGLEIGPGLAEEWGPNADQTEWTFKFREGLKWSDGKPWTTADIMYWWEDMVLNDEHPSGPPDEARSGTGTIAKFSAPDDRTLKLTFDAAAPLTPDLVACWVKRGIGPGDWMQPKHYMRQFHPTYNAKLKAKKDWVADHDAKKDFAMNPACPTMTGWRLKSFKDGVNSIWERNPYYWCVTREGDQLPYVDGLTMTFVQDVEVMKLQVIEGKVDYVHGGFTPHTLADVAAIKGGQAKNKLDIHLWDSGSGTGSIFFFNQDFIEPEMRELIRNSTFRKALSHAYDRAKVRKTVYFNQGELTTGTLSSKSIEWRVSPEGKRTYEAWRDSALKYDPAMAKQMLDEIGVVDKDGDGFRELPGGGKLVVTLDYPAPGNPETTRTNQQMAADWKAIGINAKLNPVPPTGYEDRWVAGKGYSKTAWEASDGPNQLVNAAWIVPFESSRWAPLQGAWYGVRGTPKEKQELDKDPYKRTPPRMAPEKGGPIERLHTLYDKAKLETDPLERHKLVYELCKVHIEDGPFFYGCVANYPRLVFSRQGLMNVPRRQDLTLNGYVNTWIHPTPAVYDWEAYYWDDPAAHG